MMSRKATLRGHLLVHKCIHIAKENPEILTQLDQAGEFYGKTMLESAVCSEVLTQPNKEIEKKKSELVQNSMSSQLWLNYEQVVEMARMLIKADLG